MRIDLNRTEHEEQCSVIEWSIINEITFPELDLLFAIPNGELRPKSVKEIKGREVCFSVVANKLKKEGVKAGVPDLMLPVPRGIYHGLFIEMKRRKGGAVRDTQVDWLTKLAKQGYYTVVCKGSDAAITVLKRYLPLKLNEKITEW